MDGNGNGVGQTQTPGQARGQGTTILDNLLQRTSTNSDIHANANTTMTTPRHHRITYTRTEMIALRRFPHVSEQQQQQVNGDGNEDEGANGTGTGGEEEKGKAWRKGEVMPPGMPCKGEGIG